MSRHIQPAHPRHSPAKPQENLKKLVLSSSWSLEWTWAAAVQRKRQNLTITSPKSVSLSVQTSCQSDSFLDSTDQLNRLHNSHSHWICIHTHHLAQVISGTMLSLLSGLSLAHRSGSSWPPSSHRRMSIRLSEREMGKLLCESILVQLPQDFVLHGDRFAASEPFCTCHLDS